MTDKAFKPSVEEILTIRTKDGTWTHPGIQEICNAYFDEDNGYYTGNLIRIWFKDEDGVDIYVTAMVDQDYHDHQSRKMILRKDPELKNEFWREQFEKTHAPDGSLEDFWGPEAEIPIMLTEDFWMPDGQQFCFSVFGMSLPDYNRIASSTWWMSFDIALHQVDGEWEWSS